MIKSQITTQTFVDVAQKYRPRIITNNGIRMTKPSEKRKKHEPKNKYMILKPAVNKSSVIGKV